MDWARGCVGWRGGWRGERRVIRIILGLTCALYIINRWAGLLSITATAAPHLATAFLGNLVNSSSVQSNSRAVRAPWLTVMLSKAQSACCGAVSCNFVFLLLLCICHHITRTASSYASIIWSRGILTKQSATYNIWYFNVADLMRFTPPQPHPPSSCWILETVAQTWVMNLYLLSRYWILIGNCNFLQNFSLFGHLVSAPVFHILIYHWKRRYVCM